MADREPPTGYVAIGLEAFRLRALANRLLDLAREAEDRELSELQVHDPLWDVKLTRTELAKNVRELELRMTAMGRR